MSHSGRRPSDGSPRSGNDGARAFLLTALISASLPAEAERPDGFLEEAARSAHADALCPLLVGELRDTWETQAMLASVLRQGGGRPWLLGLEIPRREQERIDAFLRSDGDARARAALARGEFWMREVRNGRSGAALLQLIDAVRSLRRSGRDIRVVCLDDLGPARGDRDARMAEALRGVLRKERAAARPAGTRCA